MNKMRCAVQSSQWQGITAGVRSVSAHKPTFSQVDNPGIVVEELLTVLDDLSRNFVWALDIFSTKVLENGAQTVIPLLLLFLCLAGIRSSELNEKLLT